MFLYSSSSSSKYLIQFEHLIVKPPNCWTSSLSTSDLGQRFFRLLCSFMYCGLMQCVVKHLMYGIILLNLLYKAFEYCSVLLIYLAGSASTELIAGISLCPFEAVKVCVQTNPGFAKVISDSFLKFINAKGTPGYDCRV
ncbi:putative mitochondrial carrier domain protein [Helianthus annuus]|nr:putative mitochondrial carrier domain protein [Helianthus annuus]